MKPKYQIGQWVRFYQNGTLVIGEIQYIHETLYGYEYLTDVGAVIEKKKHQGGKMTFTTTIPTKPGFYAWKYQHSSPIRLRILVKASEGFLDSMTMEWANLLGGLWCRLVPAEEVKKAYKEGLDDYSLILLLANAGLRAVPNK